MPARTRALSWPLILLLDEEPEETPEGAVDWLVADQLSAEVLRRCLRYVRERCNLQGTLQKLAVRDPHTGIANRQGFQAQLLDALSEHDGHGLELGYLDLDNFRHVNDALGHDAGDRLILQVVARLKAQLEVGDLLARLGGDEFALLLDTRDDAGRADAIADRIVEALAEPYWVDGESLMLGCSLGLARASAGTSADALLWHAQLAMRQAKASQGCTWCLYDEHVSRSARSLADQEGELRRALRRGELELHYQPRLCLDTGRVVGIEALVRWLHPERGLLGPDAFIPMAEESGLIVPLGYWVIARALRDLQSLHEQGADSLHMAVNLSFRQFQDSQLLPTLTRLIDERAIDPHWLEFELTETAVMRRSEQVQTAMQALGQLGVRFSLDDFGTGFSSFVHLSNLPITLLKIDKSFVASSPPGKAAAGGGDGRAGAQPAAGGGGRGRGNRRAAGAAAPVWCAAGSGLSGQPAVAAGRTAELHERRAPDRRPGALSRAPRHHGRDAPPSAHHVQEVHVFLVLAEDVTNDVFAAPAHHVVVLAAFLEMYLGAEVLALLTLVVLAGGDETRHGVGPRAYFVDEVRLALVGDLEAQAAVFAFADLGCLRISSAMAQTPRR